MPCPADRLYEILDDRFRTGRCANGDSRLEVLHDGCRWAEGPLYLPAWRQLIWSDIPNDRMLRWDEATGTVCVFRTPAGHTNGNTLDRRGPPDHLRAGQPPRHPHRARRHRHRPRRPLRTASGSTARTTRSSAPTARSGSPTRTSASPATTRAIARRARSAPATSTGSTPRPATCAWSPTASTAPTASSSPPTSSELYVSDTRAGRIRVFDVREDGTLSDGKVFAEPAAGSPLRQPPLRRRGPPVGGRPGRRRPLLRPRRHPDRPAARPRAGLQHRLRRRQEQPPLHHRHHLPVLAGDVGDRGAAPLGPLLWITPGSRGLARTSAASSPASTRPDRRRDGDLGPGPQPGLRPGVVAARGEWERSGCAYSGGLLTRSPLTRPAHRPRPRRGAISPAWSGSCSPTCPASVTRTP